MRLLLFDDFKLGVWNGEQVHDASAAVADSDHHSPQEMMEMLIRDWDNVQPRIQEAADSATGVALEDVTCCSPLPRPGQLVCLAGNYLEPAKPERGLFNAFLKSPNAALGHGGTVVLPSAEASVFHFEPELAIVIGKQASYLAAEDAMDHVFGYMDRHIPELLAEVTNVLTLQPGDVVATGTHHFGLEPVQDGDTIRLQIEQLGPALVVHCSDPSGRSWES